MCACAGYSVAIFPGKYVHIYYGRAAQNDREAQVARHGSNRLLAYLVQDRRKLGSNLLRWRDIAMMKSALIACLPYIIQTSYQPTTAHHFIMEKCVNVHKSPTKKCDELMNIHMKNVNDVYFDTNISINMRMKVNVMFIFIYIELRTVYKYIHLYHTYCYLHHLCA